MATSRVLKPFSARTPAAALTMVLALLACDPPPEISDEGKYKIQVGVERPLGSSSHALLVGTQFEPDVVGLVEGKVDRDQGGIGCATLTAEGAVEASAGAPGSFTVASAGAGAIIIQDPLLNCPANTDALATVGPDRWHVDGVEIDAVAGYWAHGYDSLALLRAGSPGPRGQFPPELGAPLHPLLVVGESLFHASPALVSVDDEAVEVRWHDPDTLLHIPAHYDDDLRPPSEDDEPGDPLSTSLYGSIPVGVSFDASIDILGHSFTLPPVEALAVEAISELELVPLYNRGNDEREWGTPAGVMAMTYDRDGRRVIGAPVEFELTRGRLGVISESDLLILHDECRRPVDETTLRGATVEARLGALAASVDLEWVALPSDPGGYGDAPDDCQGSECSCRSLDPDADPGRALAMLALFVVPALRRRARRREVAA